MKRTEPKARTVGLDAIVGPEHVYPVPKTRRAQAKYAPGPTMAGDVKPARDGRYLRYFDDVDDWAWSDFWEGQWLRDGFWPSDVQDAPWRGAVRPNAPAQATAAKPTFALEPVVGPDNEKT